MSITASLSFPGDGEQQITVPITGKVSEAIRCLKDEAMEKCNAYLARESGIDAVQEDEVNLMEEEIEEDSRDGDNSESMNLKKRKKGTGS